MAELTVYYVESHFRLEINLKLEWRLSLITTSLKNMVAHAGKV